MAVNWNRRDLLLYAVGIGARRDELRTLYELDPNWHPFPTYPLVLGLKGDHTDINNFNDMKDGGGKTPGLPPLNPERLVHAEQSIHILKPIPAVSGPGWKLTRKCVGAKDTGKGLIIDTAQELVSPSGEVYTRMVGSAYVFGKFDLGGFNKSIAPPQPLKAVSKPPAREADIVFSEKTSEEQAVIYRLSGDYNPLHIFPEIGKRLGFPGAILHGICSYGHAARAIVLKAAGGDGTRLTYMSARFTLPVMPGDELETSMWLTKIPEGTRVDFVTKNKASGKVCIGGGVALIVNKSGLKGASKL
jgi:acyl dehydratase